MNATLRARAAPLPLLVAPTASAEADPLTPGAGRLPDQIRHRTRSPAGAATPYRSYTHTLTFVAPAG
jgi:hypothetical protein